MPSLDPPGGVIPETPEELTPTWLAAILTRHGFSAAVQAIEFRPVPGALTSEVTRVIPRMQDETTGFAPPLIWKRSHDDPEARRTFRSGYAAEVSFYRDTAPELAVSIPRCLAAADDAETGAHILLLEDLAGTPVDLQRGVTPAEAESTLRELARLHAHRWQAIGRERPPESFSNLRGLIERWARVADPFLQPHLEGDVAARSHRYAETVAELFSSLSAGPETFVHGDAQPTNVILPTREGARPRLIDWQGSGRGAPLRDVARFLVLALTTEDRRVHQDDLLEAYCDELGLRGVSTDPAAIARGFGIGAQLQWGRTVLLFRFEPRWDDALRAAVPVIAQRAAAAFDDHAPDVMQQ